MNLVVLPHIFYLCFMYIHCVCYSIGGIFHIHWKCSTYYFHPVFPIVIRVVYTVLCNRGKPMSSTMVQLNSPLFVSKVEPYTQNFTAKLGGILSINMYVCVHFAIKDLRVFGQPIPCGLDGMFSGRKFTNKCQKNGLKSNQICLQAWGFLYCIQYNQFKLFSCFQEEGDDQEIPSCHLNFAVQ